MNERPPHPSSPEAPPKTRDQEIYEGSREHARRLAELRAEVRNKIEEIGELTDQAKDLDDLLPEQSLWQKIRSIEKLPSTQEARERAKETRELKEEKEKRIQELQEQLVEKTKLIRAFERQLAELDDESSRKDALERVLYVLNKSVWLGLTTSSAALVNQHLELITDPALLQSEQFGTAAAVAMAVTGVSSMIVPKVQRMHHEKLKKIRD